MRFQLVIQFPETIIKEIDFIYNLEEAIGRVVSDIAVVDGHDWGSGEANIFIHTDNPSKAFSQSKTILHSQGLLSQVKAAYRDFEEDDYIVLWPTNFKGTFDVQ